MASSLAVLRAAIVAGKMDQLTMDETAVILPGGRRLNRKEPTNFHAKRGKGDPYTLESVFFQVQHDNVKYQVYLEMCHKVGVDHVNLIDKKDLLAYLRGDISECAGLIAAKETAIDVGAELADAAMDGGHDSAPTAVKKRLRSDNALNAFDVAELSKTSRDQRCLDSVMCVASWDFSTIREKLTKEIERMRANPGGKPGGRPGASANGDGSGKGGSANAQRAYDPRGDRYSAPEDRVWREHMGADFGALGIDPTKSFKSSNAKAAASEDGRLARSSEVARSGRGTDSTGAPASSGGEKPSRAVSRAPEPRLPSHPARDERAAKRMRLSSKDLVPIIIVPGTSSTASLVTLHNIVDLLQHGQFTTAKEARAKGEISLMTARLTIRRSPSGSVPGASANYEIVSNPMKLTSAEWSRVVACVCTGQDWQFRNWEGWNSNAKDKGIPAILQKICGFVFHYDDDARPKAAEEWAVRFLPLNRNRRHNDPKIQMRFWEAIDAHCRLQKKKLRY